MSTIRASTHSAKGIHTAWPCVVKGASRCLQTSGTAFDGIRGGQLEAPRVWSPQQIWAQQSWSIYSGSFDKPNLHVACREKPWLLETPQASSGAEVWMRRRYVASLFQKMAVRPQIRMCPQTVSAALSFGLFRSTQSVRGIVLLGSSDCGRDIPHANYIRGSHAVSLVCRVERLKCYLIGGLLTYCRHYQHNYYDHYLSVWISKVCRCLSKPTGGHRVAIFFLFAYQITSAPLSSLDSGSFFRNAKMVAHGNWKVYLHR